MDNQPLVSIIIPTYNRAEYLKQAIESVLVQTYTNFELLILDNCSPDNTPDVVKQFNDPRIKYIRHQCNIRGAANWSYGIYWAKGKYISILGDDDWYLPEFISKRVDTFNKYKNILAVFSNYDTCYQNVSDSNIISPPNLCYEKILTGKELLKAAVNNEWFLGATLYKRDVVVSLLEKASMAGKTGDTLLNIYITLTPNSNVARICNKDLIYRIHPEQDSMQNKTTMWLGYISACNLILLEERNVEYRKILFDSVARIYYLQGRLSWDSGQKILSRRYFKQQLIIDPFNLITWLRYLRCFIPWYKIRKIE